MVVWMEGTTKHLSIKEGKKERAREKKGRPSKKEGAGKYLGTIVRQE